MVNRCGIYEFGVFCLDEFFVSCMILFCWMLVFIFYVGLVWVVNEDFCFD